jgi:hypothetical protein
MPCRPHSSARPAAALTLAPTARIFAVPAAGVGASGAVKEQAAFWSLAATQAARLELGQLERQGSRYLRCT